MTSLRYMGTKRTLGPTVKKAIQDCSHHGRAADLFSGMAAIAFELSSQRSVFLNDVMAFPNVFARAHCLENTLRTPRALLPEIYPLFVTHRAILRQEFAERIARDDAALGAGGPALCKWMLAAPHVGNSNSYERMARYSRTALNYKRYRLATLYFSSSYFSTTQAIDLDSIRFALSQLRMSKKTSAPVMAVWLATASRIINSPGHSAQFLKPNNPVSFKRIKSQLTRDVWSVFTEIAHEFRPWGSAAWRKANSVVQGDALDIVAGYVPEDVSVVYADPPYTKDQYSRFYHVFETLLLYDYPRSHGIGRYRGGRYASPFCHTTGVVGAFERLFKGVQDLGMPLVLSYPSDGMLDHAGIKVEDFIRDHFSKVKVLDLPSSHSTMGGSKGSARKTTLEHIFICK